MTDPLPPCPFCAAQPNEDGTLTPHTDDCFLTLMVRRSMFWAPLPGVMEAAWRKRAGVTAPASVSSAADSSPDGSPGPCGRCGCDQIQVESHQHEVGSCAFMARRYCRNCEWAGPRGFGATIFQAVDDATRKWNEATPAPSAVDFPPMILEGAVDHLLRFGRPKEGSDRYKAAWDAVKKARDTGAST